MREADAGICTCRFRDEREHLRLAVLRTQYTAKMMTRARTGRLDFGKCKGVDLGTRGDECVLGICGR